MRRRDVKRSWWIVVSLALLVSSGCAAKQSGTARPSGFLRDYSQLAKGKEGEAQLVYVNPQADFRTIPRDEAQLLADELDDALRFTLRADFKLVERAGPDVLRLRSAITEAAGSWHVEDRIASRYDTELRATMPSEPSTETRDFVGRAGVEGEVLDSLTGERLLAAVDRRAGAHTLQFKKNSWQDVKDAFAYWAERLRVRLVTLRTKG
ncbi:MAG: DUF3313 domain-containing protein [Deltaproteobacteria bacterium]|nr:MAG: DUF3313 domain-containing protein [Deltaproteobacteria bacterium]